MSSMTQRTSEERVQKDLIGDDVMKDIYNRYRTDTNESFFEHCRNVIQNSCGKQQTKMKFIDKLERNKTNKTAMIKIISNYALAGMGYGI